MLVTALLLLTTHVAAVLSQASSTLCQPLANTKLPRIFVLTDISNEPDDQESLVRLLVHADLYNVTGIVAVTSYWLNSTTYPGQIQEVISNYSLVQDNLQAQSDGTFPNASSLSSLVFSGPLSYGLDALNDTSLSNGTTHLISTVDSSPEPLYIQAWGGVNTLAQALNHVSTTRTPADLATFLSKLRVYTISDQDNSGFWIRRTFPQIQYISSLHGWNAYGQATWPGISGEIYYPFDIGGPDSSLVTKSWLAQHIQIGLLGNSSYLTPAFIMEGDSPSLLYTMSNGLNYPADPSYGSWGGRYTLADISRVSGNHYSDTLDTVTGQNGQTFVSNKATIWRWRRAFQAEFAARMQWTLTGDRSAENVQHPPVVVVNGSCDLEPLVLDVDPSQVLMLDASASFSPDADGEQGLNFTWFHYREPSLTQSSLLEVPEIPIECLDTACTQVQLQVSNVTVACAASQALHPNPGDGRCKSYHVVLTVRNERADGLGMERYKRVVLDVQRPANWTRFM